MRRLYLICENCHQVVARFDPSKVEPILDGAMFESHLADRDVRPPWQPGVTAPYMTCPLCPMRVFNQAFPEELRVSDNAAGLHAYNYELTQPTQETEPELEVQGGFMCPGCGKEYARRATYERYHQGRCPQGG